VSFQHGVLESRADMDVSGRILQNWMPAIHAGMTNLHFSFSVSERKITNHFVVYSLAASIYF
jgi:hypothetical protein